MFLGIEHKFFDGIVIRFPETIFYSCTRILLIHPNKKQSHLWVICCLYEEMNALWISMWIESILATQH